MTKKPLPGGETRSEMLLALAEYWRNCAARSNEAWRSDIMRGTAEEFEKAAARVAGRTQALGRTKPSVPGPR